MSRRSIWIAAVALAAACRAEPTPATLPVAVAPSVFTPHVVRDTLLTDDREVAGITTPFREAVLGSRMMATLQAVLVEEGAVVRRGALLARLDAAEVNARRAQGEAGLDAAEAQAVESRARAGRMRGLALDSAATPAQLDAAERDLAAAEAGVRVARAGLQAASAAAGYAVLHAPFEGVIARRHADPGALVGPGMPLLVLHDRSRLRARLLVEPAAAARLRPGASVPVTIEEVRTRGTVEAVVPAGGALQQVNIIIANPEGRLLSGTTARVRLPGPPRTALLVPTAALQREGALTGVRMRAAGVETVRWVTVGDTVGALTEALAGLAAGDTILVRTAQP